jgi:diadenosine tetraphosphatase ApaH/serine/threonine PP2A family protein phosphatase
VRVAALYDVHGNLPALEAVLAEVEREGVDVIVSGGDVVWGPLPAECLEGLRTVGARFVRGNADRDVVEGDDPIDRFAAMRLSEEQREFVASWPLSLELDVPPLGRILFCHATPRSDKEIVTRATPDDEVVGALDGVDATLVVGGHTHVQFDRQPEGAPRFVNAGSVGMPYEGSPDARWALLGRPDVDLRRTPYDVEAAIRQIEATGMPQAERIVENALRGRISAEEATSFWETQRTSAK